MSVVRNLLTGPQLLNPQITRTLVRKSAFYQCPAETKLKSTAFQHLPTKFIALSRIRVWSVDSWTPARVPELR